MAKIDFPDRGVPAVYGQLAEDCVNALSEFYDDMAAMCRAHGYRPMVIFTNNLQTFYSEDFRSHVLHTFEQWNDSGASLPALARRVKAGPDAVSTANGFMHELRERLEGMFQRSFTPIRVDDSAPSLSEQDIARIEEHINRFVTKAEAAKERALSLCRSRSSDNMLYELIEPTLENTGTSLCESMSSAVKAVMEGTELYTQGIAATLADLVRGQPVVHDVLKNWPADVPFC